MFAKITAVISLLVACGGALGAWAAKIRPWIEKVSPDLEAIIKDVEERAKDHKIDKEERKQIAMLEIARLEKRGVIKLNFITRIILGKVVDSIAQKLPDFRFNYPKPNGSGISTL